MKHLILIALCSFTFLGNAQTNEYNLELVTSQKKDIQYNDYLYDDATNYLAESITPHLEVRKTANNSYVRMPRFKRKNWRYKYVNMKGKISDLTGEVKLLVKTSRKMKDGATVKISIIIDGSSPRSGLYTVLDYTDTGKEHKWDVKSQKNGVISSIYIFKKKKYIRKIYLDGLLIMGKGDSQITFYLQ